MKILMVCLGNICRSPLAEGILQQKADAANLKWIVESAGTNGYHSGKPPHHLSIKVAKQNGIDIEKQISRQFIAEDIEKYDIVYAMANDVLRDIRQICRKNFDTKKVRLFLAESFPGEDRDVPDPWYGEEEGYHKVFDIINDNCKTIITKHLKSAIRF